MSVTGLVRSLRHYDVREMVQGRLSGLLQRPRTRSLVVLHDAQDSTGIPKGTISASGLRYAAVLIPAPAISGNSGGPVVMSYLWQHAYRSSGEDSRDHRGLLPCSGEVMRLKKCLWYRKTSERATVMLCYYCLLSLMSVEDGEGSCSSSSSLVFRPRLSVLSPMRSEDPAQGGLVKVTRGSNNVIVNAQR